MFNQEDFGKRLKAFRRSKNFTQKDIAFRIDVSEQAVSKWENGECLPDLYNLRLLCKILRVPADTLLDTENENSEKVAEVIKIGRAEFEIVKKPETILAGKIIHAKDYETMEAFHQAIDAVPEEEKLAAFSSLRETVLPVADIHLSVNFWLARSRQAYGYVREVGTENQPEGIGTYKMPASLYIRAYTCKENAQLLAKEECETWELFAYIRDYFMPAHGFKMADNGAQELEVFDSLEHRSGCVYVPVIRQ